MSKGGCSGSKCWIRSWVIPSIDPHEGGEEPQFQGNSEKLRSKLQSLDNQGRAEGGGYAEGGESAQQDGGQEQGRRLEISVPDQSQTSGDFNAANERGEEFWQRYPHRLKHRGEGGHGSSSQRQEEFSRTGNDERDSDGNPGDSLLGSFHDLFPFHALG
jgi:hypothetical protein